MLTAVETYGTDIRKETKPAMRLDPASKTEHPVLIEVLGVQDANLGEIIKFANIAFADYIPFLQVRPLPLEVAHFVLGGGRHDD